MDNLRVSPKVIIHVTSKHLGGDAWLWVSSNFVDGIASGAVKLGEVSPAEWSNAVAAAVTVERTLRESFLTDVARLGFQDATRELGDTAREMPALQGVPFEIVEEASHG